MSVFKRTEKLVSWCSVRSRCPLSFNRDWQRNVVTFKYAKELPRPEELRVLLIQTEEFAVDLGRFVCWGEKTLPAIWPVTDVFHWPSALFFSTRDKIRLLSIVFFVVRAIHVFEFSLVINCTPNQWRPVARSCSETDLCFWQDLYVIPRPSSRDNV
jgi:hypothetical protein